MSTPISSRDFHNLQKKVDAIYDALIKPVKKEPIVTVSLSQAKKITGLTSWQIRAAFEQNNDIRPKKNRYNIELLKSVA